MFGLGRERLLRLRWETGTARSHQARDRRRVYYLDRRQARKAATLVWRSLGVEVDDAVALSGIFELWANVRHVWKANIV